MCGCEPILDSHFFIQLTVNSSEHPLPRYPHANQRTLHVLFPSFSVFVLNVGRAFIC
jgi:hypothetical protein